jgi:hypothetical protein
VIVWQALDVAHISPRCLLLTRSGHGPAIYYAEPKFLFESNSKFSRTVYREQLSANLAPDYSITGARRRGPRELKKGAPEKRPGPPKRGPSSGYLVVFIFEPLWLLADM